MEEYNPEHVLFYNGVPVAHAKSPDIDSLYEKAWELMGSAGYEEDCYHPSSEDTVKISDYKDFTSTFDYHSGISSPCWMLFDAENEPVSIVILGAPFYHRELPGSDWFGCSGDDMEEAFLAYCEEHDIDPES